MEPRKESQGGVSGDGAGQLNGIDTRTLFDTIDQIKEDPTKAHCKFFSTTSWRRGTTTDCRITRYELGGEEIPQDYTITADEPKALLGTDAAPNPQMLLYAALSSCILNGFVVNAAAKGIRIDRLELDVEGDLDLRGFLGLDETINPGYDELVLVCRVKGDGTKEQFEELMEAGTKYSPNFQTISRPIQIRYRVEMQ